MRSRLREQLARSGLLDANAVVLVAVSGGIDSVCLLHALHFATPRPLLVAAHFDHRMRPDSARDAHWVRGLCRAWCVPLVCTEAAEPPRSEARARTLRYAFLERAADTRGAAWIVTGHHADDQAETVLFRLARGTGVPGLAGIAARRGRIVRPFLGTTRAELRAYARANGLTWRDDPTNCDLRFARNWIRARVLPLLETIQPGAARRIAALAHRAAEAESGWKSVVQQALQNVVTHADEASLALARDRLLAYHPHVRARVLRQLLRDVGSEPGRTGTTRAVHFVSSGASGARIHLAGGVTLSREYDRLLLRRSTSPPPPDVSLSILSPDPGVATFRLGGHWFQAEWGLAAGWAHAEPDTNVSDHPGGTALPAAASFDPAALRFPLELRSWRPGDRIRFRYGSKKLKELFRERRMGRTTRACVPVLQDASGRILWLAGMARAHDADEAKTQGFRILVRHVATS